MVPSTPAPAPTPPSAAAPPSLEALGGLGTTAPTTAAAPAAPVPTASTTIPPVNTGYGGERMPDVDPRLTDRQLPASSRALSQLAAQRGRLY